MGKRGSKPQYDFEAIIDSGSITIKNEKLASFKTLLSTFNKGKEPKIEFEYSFKNSNVTASVKKQTVTA